MQKTLSLKAPVGFVSAAAVGGKMERSGPLGRGFDFCDVKDTFGEKTFELAESKMVSTALNIALKKARLPHTALDIIAAGDLQNQCAATSFALTPFCAPLIGLYGACSTLTEGIAVLSSLMNASEDLKYCAAVTSSHNATAERQFRTPLEYGGQRAKCAQWTATAAGAFILSKERARAAVFDVTFGIPRDGGTKDATNMGPAMAFAAADTVISYFERSELVPSDFDCIVTGDLGFGGSSLLCEILSKKDRRLAEIHTDCGTLIYDKGRQDCHSGASGCGTSAAVLAAHFLPKLEKGELKRILFLSTGALMSPSSVLQGENILGISPLLRFSQGD